ncbi:MAG: hypothetical protein ACE5PM_03860 [Candidatus Hydrothermarchaeales archaeon]
MSERFLSPEELSKRLVSFKDMWYGIPQKSEALSNFRSGFDAGFKEAIAEISSDVEACKKEIEDLSASLEHHMPETRGEVGELARTISGALDDLATSVKTDLTSLKKYESLRPKLEKLEREFEDAEGQYQDTIRRAENLCEEYESAKRAYDKRIRDIKKATDKRLEDIRKNFIHEFDTYFEGFDLLTKGSIGEKIDGQTLFRSLIRDSGFYKDVEIAQKGFGGLVGKRESDIEVRKALLRYKAREISREIEPALEEEKGQTAKLAPELKRINELKDACENLNGEKGRIQKEKEELAKKIADLKSDGAQLMGKYSTYEKILDIRESYVNDFNNMNTLRKELFALIGDWLKGYEPLEPDVEKRELKAEIGALSTEIEDLKGRNSELIKELERTNEEYERYRGEVEGKLEEIENLLASEKERKARIKELEDENKEIKGQLWDALDKLEGVLDKLEDAEKEVEDYKSRLADEEEKRHKLQDAKAKLEGRLNEALDKYAIAEKEIGDIKRELVKEREAYATLQAEYEETAAELREVNSTIDTLLSRRKRTKSKSPRKKGVRGEEEQIVGEKIEALRERKET